MSRELVRRADKKAFWGIITVSGETTTTTFTRMRGFTDFSGSKNPKEYSRQYIDEEFEQTDVTGYSPSWSFGFDEYTDDDVLADIVGIIDDEKTGDDATRDIVFVNFAKPGTTAGTYEAVKRTFAVIADSEGGSTDAYTYSGNLKVKSSAVKGTVVIATPVSGTPENAETVTFTAAA